ncbi:MAG: c-type cytochrome [Myxococcota bacterium]
MSQEKDRLLGHGSDNDGIDEYDNALPDWWLGLFVLCVIWGIGYAIDYHFVHHRSQVASYDAEMVAAKERWPDSGAHAIAMDAASIDAGAQVFAANCVACHSANLTGGIGPSLVDATWIHGGEPAQIQTTITSGVPAKGMITWGPILGPEKIAQVTAFIVTKAKEGPPPGTVAAPPPPGTPDGTQTLVTAAPIDPGHPAGPVSGEDVFKQNCVVCHGEAMEGKVGPSLVDATWIHGGTLPEIEHTITVGVPDKGMVTWGPILGPEKVKAVAEYIYSKGAGAGTAVQ